MQQAALFSLCGVASIVTNHWSTMPEDGLAQFQHLMRGMLGEGVYLGSIALKKGRTAPVRPTTEQSRKQTSDARVSSAGAGSEEQPGEDARLSIYKHNMITIGVPFLRVV